MSPRRWTKLSIACGGLAMTLLTCAIAGPLARGEVEQKGKVRVKFSGSLTPRHLPRNGAVPVAVALGGKILTTDGSQPPQLRTIELAINSHGQINYAGLPVCRLEDIQPATTANALAACGKAKVGEGHFDANVSVPGQAPFPADGRLIAFNGVERGKHVIFAHVYGTEPLPTSYTVPFYIRRGRGAFGTVLRASLPKVVGNAGFVTGVRLDLDRRFRAHGETKGFISAGCPAPKGLNLVPFKLLRMTFRFVGGAGIGSTLIRTCHATG